MKYLTLVPLKFKKDEKLASSIMIELPPQWVKHNDEGRMKTESLVMRISGYGSTRLSFSIFLDLIIRLARVCGVFPRNRCSAQHFGHVTKGLNFSYSRAITLKRWCD